MRDTIAIVVDRTQRAIIARAGTLFVCAASLLLWQGRFTGLRLEQQRWREIVVLGALLVAFVWRTIGRRQRVASAWEGVAIRVELGLMLLALVSAAIQIVGGPHTWAQPLVYVCIAYLVGFNTQVVGGILAVAAMGMQLALQAGATGLQGHWHLVAARSAFILVFTLSNLVFLQIEVMRRRREHARRLADELRAMREEARDFRLVSTRLSSRDADNRDVDEAKLARGAIEAIHQGMLFILDSLKRSLDLQTCILLWLDASGRQLCIKELVTESEMVCETPIPAQAGALGGIVKNRLLLNLRDPRGVARGLPYYAGVERVGAFIGVPVLEGGHLRGVLCADRRDDRVFTSADERVLLQAADQVLRAIQTEQVVTAVERSKYEHERFHKASTMLNSALTLDQVYETAFAAAREVAHYDFAAVTLYNAERRKHVICRVNDILPESTEGGQSEPRTSQWKERLVGAEFSDNAGLVAMVVKNKHFLPAGDGPRDVEAVVFSRSLRLKHARSVLVMPLIVKDVAVGTFVLASRVPSRFCKRTREMLGVISNQVAVAIENAKMYRQMEEMATTDGLTGLPNHRTFQSGFLEMLQRAERHKKPVSMVLTDVDRFKGINDTYGHPVGDQVLRQVSAVMAEHVRKVDLVARYGGEEFAIVLEETDAAGARLLCERVRQRIAAQVLNSEKGAFRVTISLGIASYPLDGAQKEELIDRADQALYAAKQGGRNRTICYNELRGAKRKSVGA